MSVSTKLKDKKKFNYSVMEKRTFPFVYFILLLPVSQVAIFFFYVNFSAIALSFQSESGNFSLENIRYVVNAFKTGEDYYLASANPTLMLRNSVLMWVNIHLVGFAISIFTAFMLTKHMIGARWFRIAYQIPTIVGAVVLTTIMQGIYRETGPVVGLLTKIGVELPPFARDGGLLASEQTAFKTLMIQAFIFTLSGGNLVIAGAYQRIPEEVFESAKLEGCGFFREAFQIAIPCIWPTISTITVFALCSFFTCDYNFYLYSNGTGHDGMVSIGYILYRYSLAVANNAETAGGLYNYASSFGMFITCITLPVVFLGRWLLTKVSDDVAF